jgi:NitT/TauT family transport system ATP-binding protein
MGAVSKEDASAAVAKTPATTTVVEPAISIKGATKRYGTRTPSTTILDGIDLTVAKKEFVSIIGPSGCGKSTLLKLVAGLNPITKGSIAIDGMTPENAREIVSFIFQDATLLPWRTVHENVVLGLELEGMAKARRNEKVDAVLQMVGLAHVAERFPRELSGGMKMRVSIARALATRPRLLLMDEPFAALDEMTRDRMNEELLRLRAEQGWTVLFVTHSVAEAVFLSSRVVVLAPHPGRVAHCIDVNLPYPRDEATRESEAFDQLVNHTSRLLREAHKI